MSSIPAAAMPHAKTHETEEDTADAATLTERAKTQAKSVSEAAEKVAGKATEAVKNNPKTAAAVGVAVLAAGAAAIALPLGKKSASKPATRKPSTKKTPPEA